MPHDGCLLRDGLGAEQLPLPRPTQTVWTQNVAWSCGRKGQRAKEVACAHQGLDKKFSECGW